MMNGRSLITSFSTYLAVHGASSRHSGESRNPVALPAGLTLAFPEAAWRSTRLHLRHRVIVILSITAFALVLIPLIVHAADFIDLFRQGLDAEDAGNLDQAQSRFSDALSLSAKALKDFNCRLLFRGNPLLFLPFEFSSNPRAAG